MDREKPLCFGSKQWNNISNICLSCYWYKVCGEVESKTNNNASGRSKYYYYCRLCHSKNIEWFFMKKDYDKEKDPIGKCKDCDEKIMVKVKKSMRYRRRMSKAENELGNI